MANIFKRSYVPYVFFLAGVVLIFLWASQCKAREGFADVPEAPYKFVMYYADWCPHCHRAKPEFDKLGAVQTIGGKKVEIVALEEKDIPENVKVEGYPTIRLLTPEGGVIEEYGGERSHAGFQAFLKSKLE